MTKRKFEYLGIEKIEEKKKTTAKNKKISIEVIPEVETLITQCNAALKASPLLKGNCNQHIVKGANLGLIKELQWLLKKIKAENDKHYSAEPDSSKQSVDQNSEEKQTNFLGKIGEFNQKNR